MAQLPVRELAKTLGFQIKTCLNKSSFFEAIKTGPELLIIDTHGGVDETTHNSFIMMGDDIITGDDVVNSGIEYNWYFSLHVTRLPLTIP